MSLEIKQFFNPVCCFYSNFLISKETSGYLKKKTCCAKEEKKMLRGKISAPPPPRISNGPPLNMFKLCLDREYDLFRNLIKQNINAIDTVNSLERVITLKLILLVKPCYR